VRKLKKENITLDTCSNNETNTAVRQIQHTCAASLNVSYLGRKFNFM